ncbi:unnamed protein product [Prunus armeniaca]
MLVQAYNLMVHGFLPFLLLSCIISTNIHACKQTERNSLLSFASTLSSPPLNWTSLDCCRWKGITCDQDGWVTSLLLPSKWLKGVDLSSNHFFGAIPSSFFQQASNLTSFNVSNNNFTGGELPLNLGKLSKLKFVTFDFNNLEGALPPSLMNCTNLVELRLENNTLEGDISMLDFSRLSQLIKLDLRVNNFTGTIPVSLYSCRSLKAIRLSKNHLEGQIQAEILSLKSLSFLSLGGNRFTNLTWAVKILMSFKSLHTLMLAGSYEGEGMPSDDDMVDFDGFQNLRRFSLAGSHLNGQIPLWLSKLKNLELLELGFNQITGPIPSWLGTLPRLFYINLSNNRISATIVLSNNNISGDIPTKIGQLQLLQELYLDSNNFSGVIPDQISNLKNLEVLNLSMNLLSGIIPSSLASLNFLREFNTSYNNLEGPIPIGTQLQSFNASAFEGNPKLCGVPLPNKCEPNKCIDADNKNNKDEGQWASSTSMVLYFCCVGVHSRILGSL